MEEDWRVTVLSAEESLRSDWARATFWKRKFDSGLDRSRTSWQSSGVVIVRGIGGTSMESLCGFIPGILGIPVTASFPNQISQLSRALLLSGYWSGLLTALLPRSKDWLRKNLGLNGADGGSWSAEANRVRARKMLGNFRFQKDTKMQWDWKASPAVSLVLGTVR